MKKENKAFINNYDLISCAGNSIEETFSSILNKSETISLNDYYVKDKVVAIGIIKSKKNFEQLLIEKCQKILEHSNLGNYTSTLLIVGSSVGGMKSSEDIFFNEKNYKNINPKYHPIDAIATILKNNFTFYDDISFSTACTSSANALGYAKEVLTKGIYKNVLVVGADSLTHTTVCGFSALSVLSSEACTPFDKNRKGMNVAEGIGILLLQNEPNENSIELAGVGYSSDAHHMTQPHPEGFGALEAMEKALKNANLTIKDIGYINAHGTGTQANDLAELQAIKLLFKDYKPFVSSTKSITGHTLGAAGAIEAIISSHILEKQIIPPNKNLINIEVEDINYSLETIKTNLKYVMSNSFAFGGNNTSLIFGIKR